jgi:hypothetical protein
MYFRCKKLENTFCGAWISLIKDQNFGDTTFCLFCLPTWASCLTKRTLLPTPSRPSLSFNSLSIPLIKQQLAAGKARRRLLNPKPRKPRKQPSLSLQTTTLNFFNVCSPSTDRTLPIKPQNGKDSVSNTSIRRQKRTSQLAVFEDQHSPFSSSERDAIDVENVNDYRKMVANLAESEPDKIKILVDMKVIQSSCGKVVSPL